MNFLGLALLSIFSFALAEDAAKGNQKNDEMMKNLQKFLMQAEKEGNADKPMMIKEVDGKMVMEPIPQEILDTFEFPKHLSDDDEQAKEDF